LKKLDKFIVSGFVGPFVGILAIAIFILVMQFLWVYIDELVGKGLGFRVILEFMFWGACTVLPLALPLATLLSSMMTVGQMSEHNELMAIKSAGISLSRVLLPLSIVSVIISVCALFVCNDLVPKAVNQIYTLRDDIARTKNEIKIPSGIFYDGIEGYILRVDDRNDETGMMYGVMVYDHTTGKGNNALMLADSAQMKLSKQKDYLTFTLYSGANYQETNTRAGRDTTRELQHIDFDMQQLVIPLKNYSFEKSDSTRFGDQIRALKMDQLEYNIDSLTLQTNESHEKQYKQMRVASNFLLRGQLDTASRAEGRPIYKNEDFLEWNDLAKEIRAYEKARDNAKKMQADLNTNQNETYEYYYTLRKTKTEFFRRFSQALACLLLFFIGAPLGALIKKGGLGTSAIISALFFVLYWVVDITGTKLAKDGATPAVVGTFISAAVLGPIGAFLTFKAINDSSLLKNDSFAGWWRKIKSKVAQKFRPTRIVFMGTPEFAVASLDALVQGGYKVVGVVTVADKPSGRGLKMNESAVKKYAVEHNLPVLQPVKLKDPEFLEQLAAWKPDLFVVVAFRMLPEVVWSMPKLGTFNLHAALLPQYRGAAPINWAVINGEKITGVTTFMIDKNIDTGGIILREECRIGPEDTAGDVHDKLMEIGAKLVVTTTEGIIQHNVETRVQRSFIQGSEVLKPAPKLTTETCHIDWNKPSTDIYNLIRGLSPYPTAFTTLEDKDGKRTDLKIFFGKVAEGDIADAGKAAAPGTVLSDGKGYLAIATADGAISLTDIQLSGKKRMEVKAFLAGFRNPESYKAV